MATPAQKSALMTALAWACLSLEHPPLPWGLPRARRIEREGGSAQLQSQSNGLALCHTALVPRRTGGRIAHSALRHCTHFGHCIHCRESCIGLKQLRQLRIGSHVVISDPFILRKVCLRSGELSSHLSSSPASVLPKARELHVHGNEGHGPPKYTPVHRRALST